MGKPMVNLQDSFLNQVRKDNAPIKIVLVDGSHLEGTVRGFDNFTINVVSQGNHHLVYKHAIAHIISSRPVQRDEDRPPDRGGEGRGGEARGNEGRGPEGRGHEGRGNEGRGERGDRRPRPAPGGPPPAPEKKPEGFNTLDLSKVNLES